VRAPLSWLRDFAPFEAEPAVLAATLDDLGLVVEGIEVVGEGIDDVVVARVLGISAIEGADRIRLTEVDAGGDEPVEVVCGATNFAVGDLVPLAPVGAVLPGDFAIARRTMKGVVSNGMLCSGAELGLSEDGAGLLLLTDVDGARPGMPLAEALGIERDVVFDLTVEGNRPDAWSMAGVARDLAGRLGLPFTLPLDAAPTPSGEPAAELASVVLEDRELCPRLTARVLTGVRVGPSPRWLARRLTLAGMRPINNVVDASNYVMLELGQPTHPYDLDRLAGPGLVVRRARPGETLVTLDGVERRLGTPGRGLGDTGQDCVICDALGQPVGVGGVMGGASSEITPDTTRVLLEAAYFTPMAIARTSKRLGLRTEASARFERGCDPWGIDRAAERFCALLAASDPAVVLHPGTFDERGDVPVPFTLDLAVSRVNGLLGTDVTAEAVGRLLGPLGFGTEPWDDGSGVTVTVPTDRPDVRPHPHGLADVIEEVARVAGYAALDRRQPSWPQPGGLTSYQSDRRLVRQVLCGLGASEAWTPSFVGQADQDRLGLAGPSVAVANPLDANERLLRRSQLPGLVRAVAYNAERRQPAIRLFEVGTVFSHPDERGRPVERSGAGGSSTAVLPGEREMLSVALAADDDDARSAVAAWQVVAAALRLEGVEVQAPVEGAGPPGLHPTRSAWLVAGTTTVGSLGEVDPALVAELGAGEGRVGWLEVDLGLVLDPTVVPRASLAARLPSRYPSSDIDLALVVDDQVPAARVAQTLRHAGGPLLERLELFDVFRGPAIGSGRRSLAFRLRFCADDHTLTDAEVADLRRASIEAAEALGAVLR